LGSHAEEERVETTLRAGASRSDGLRGYYLSIRRPGYWVVASVIASAYAAAAKFGISLPVADGVITPVWAPTGIALAALVLLGYRLWPAVALAAFLVNATSGVSLALAAGISVGNTLEALAGGYLLRRFRFDPRFARVRDVLLFVVLGASICTLVSASIGASVVSLGTDGDRSYASSWLLWWFGDAVGALMVAPLLLIVFASPRSRPRRAVLVEGLALLALLAVLSAAIFLAGAWGYPYIIFPALLWAAVRFRQLGAAAASFLLGAIATWGAVAGTVSLETLTATERVQIVQVLVALVAVSLLVVGSTLAERERLLALAQAQNERLHELDRVKDTFIASVSHELRTPLTSIIGFLELLEEGTNEDLTKQQRRYVEVALRNAGRLHRLIADLLFVAQTDAGELALTRHPVDLPSLVRECLESLRPWAQEAGIELRQSGEPTPPFNADPVRLAQLVDNLVSNAIKFSDRGGSVEVRVFPSRRGLALEVSDSGRGIPADEQLLVFDRFYRSAGAAKQAIQGTGLGLAIAKMIVEAHGGTIGLSSRPESGSTFRCEFPLGPVAPAAPRSESPGQAVGETR
jgi:signal transduction histidine kinase